VGECSDDEAHLIVVADPDLLSNAGLARGDNAEIVASLLRHLQVGDEVPLIIDETLQPHHSRSIFAGLLHFPSVLGVLQLLLLLGLTVWAGLVRFGAPVPEPESGLRGASALVEGAVTLQSLAGSAMAAVRALHEAARREVLDRLHAPAGLQEGDLDRWLDARRPAAEVAASRTLRGQVMAASSPRAALAAAQSVQRWRERMLHGAR
jgi:hypothetical protein